MAILQTLFKGLAKPQQTGVTCERCGWNGKSWEVIKAAVQNEDSTIYRIDTCPRCLRNGRLTYHDK